MTEWRPIESAPKDGSHFLAYDPVVDEYDVCSMTFFDVRGGIWYCSSLQIDGEYGSFECEFNAERATHWMPLPEPPKEPEQ